MNVYLYNAIIMRCFLGVFLIWMLTGIGAVGAQEQEQASFRDFRLLEVKGHAGSHIYTGESLEEALENGYRSVEVRYGWQSCNPDSWQSMYLYPAYGIGWYSGFIGNPDLLGMPGAFYAFISFPLLRHNRHALVLDPAAGLSFDFKPYHSEDNPLNDAISSRFNIYFNLNFGAIYRLNREMDLLYGIDLTHFSNGRTFRPNAGLNMLGLNVGLRYNFNARQNRVDNAAHPKLLLDSRPRLEGFRKVRPVMEGNVLVYGAGGLVQNTEDKGTGKQYTVFSTLLEYQYRFNTRSGVTAGLDFFFDNSLKGTHPGGRRDFYGTHLGYDFMFWRLTIRMQAGTYLHGRGHELKGNYFLRPAIKYDFSETLFLQVGLKTLAGFRADWIETGIGVKL